MAKCAICGKGPTVGHSVSHANNRTKRRWLPNVQKISVLMDGTAQRMVVCSACLRSGRVAKNPGNIPSKKGAPAAARANTPSPCPRRNPIRGMKTPESAHQRIAIPDHHPLRLGT